MLQQQRTVCFTICGCAMLLLASVCAGAAEQPPTTPEKAGASDKKEPAAGTTGKKAPWRDPTKTYYTAWMGERMVVDLTQCPIYNKDAAPKTPTVDELDKKDSVSQYGITWRFDKKVPVGKFINGDWYVVGPVTIVDMDPKPRYGAEVTDLVADQPVYVWEFKDPKNAVRNGSTLNIPAVAPRCLKNPSADRGCGFDSRIPSGRFDPAQTTKLPIEMKPGDALCSSLSAKNEEIASWSGNHVDCVKLAAVLTCLAEPQPADAFRPSYCESKTSKVYLARNLKRDVFLSLPKPVSVNKDKGLVARLVRAYQLPHIDVTDFGFGYPVEAFPEGIYGDGQCYTNGATMMLLNMDFTAQEKEPLIVNLVQVGIDYWGLARGGRKWQAWGGLHSGRKLPILVAGLLLDDKEMQDPYKAVTTVRFQEDDQTAMCPITYRGTVYEHNWMGAKAIFMGHSLERDGGGQWEALSGPVDLVHPKDWPTKKSQTRPELIRNSGSENYRRCCTSTGWVSQALAFRIMHLEKLWNHDPYFAYVDRWMTEDDTPMVEALKEAGSQDWTKAPRGQTNRFGNTGSNFGDITREMWKKYRNNLPPAADGSKTPSDTETWK
ncbi:MAG: hypothetical protein AAB263_22525 [Planctomycetota bacterium]